MCALKSVCVRAWEKGVYVCERECVCVSVFVCMCVCKREIELPLDSARGLNLNSAHGETLEVWVSSNSEHKFVVVSHS